MQIESIVKDEINEEEQKLREKFKVSHIRMPGSKILASEIEKNLDHTARLFAHVICAWTVKGIIETIEGLDSLLQVTSIHPSLLYARVCKEDVNNKRRMSDEMQIFDLEKYDANDEENFGNVSPAVQMFYILADRADSTLLQEWADDHVIPNSYLESFSKENFDSEKLAKFKDFVENMVKTFSHGFNIFISQAYQEKKETIDYLCKLCDIYMLCTDGERNIKNEMLNATNEDERTALAIVANWSNLSMVEYLIDKGADINELSPWLQQSVFELKSEKHKKLSEELPKDDKNKRTAEFLERLEEDLKGTNKKQKSSGEKELKQEEKDDFDSDNSSSQPSLT